jgi:3-oxoacyl-[acyl-carrier protein] reductase
MQLKDLKVIVTGGAQGMGAHFAMRLHEAGAQVAVGDVNEERLAALPAGIHRRRLDVSTEADCTAFVQWAHEVMGGLNGLINNAGILRDSLLVQTDQRPGVIVNMSSIARHGNRGQSNYVSAKAALAANTVTWSREFAPFGIRVGAVAPGMVETPMTQGMNQKARDALVANIPVGRIGLPEDLWLAVKFVLECDYFNGRTLDVDGGLNM